VEIINHLKSNINAFCLPSYLTNVVTDCGNPKLYTILIPLGVLMLLLDVSKLVGHKQLL